MSRTKNIIGVNASHASTIQNHDWMNAALQLLAEKPKKAKNCLTFASDFLKHKSLASVIKLFMNLIPAG